MFNNVNQLLGLLQQSDLDILISATMIIGNVARSGVSVSLGFSSLCCLTQCGLTDEHSIKLVEAGVANALAQIVQHKDTRLQQLGAGALRNLSLPLQNKVNMHLFALCLNYQRP